MIEQAMIFTLGACVAGLLALLCLPAISRRAMRFAQIAVERQMPISVGEIVAQRDLLRAEFATERRRVEQALEAANAAQAHEMGQSGRRAAEIGRLTGVLDTRTGERDAALVAQATAERSAIETGAENGALQKQLWDADGLERRLRDELASLRGEHKTLTQADAAKAQAVKTLAEERDAKASAADALEAALGEAKLDLSLARAEGETLRARLDNSEDSLRATLATEGALRTRIVELERGGPADEDIAMLRRTIVEIGREVVRLAGDAPNTGSPGNERVDAQRSVAVN